MIVLMILIINNQYVFERTDSFKYHRTPINRRNYLHQRVQQKIDNVNRAYFTNDRLCKQKLRSKKLKIKY